MHNCLVTTKVNSRTSSLTMVNNRRRGTVHGTLGEISANRMYSTRLAVKASESADHNDDKKVKIPKLPSIAMLRTSMQNLKRSVDQLQKNKISLTKPKQKRLNVLVLGAKNVGKSALVVRYLTRRFIGDYMSGEDQRYEHAATHLKHHDKVVFLDTSDSEEKTDNEYAIDEAKLDWADGVMVVYDVGNLATFQYAKSVINTLCGKCRKVIGSNSNPVSKKFGSENPGKRNKNCRIKPLLLIGNKADLWHNRRVTVLEAQRTVHQYHDLLDYEELSAAEGYDDVRKSLDALVTKIHYSKTGRSMSF